MAHETGGKQQRKAQGAVQQRQTRAPEGEQPAVQAYAPFDSAAVQGGQATPNLEAASQEVHGEPLAARGAQDTQWAAASPMDGFYFEGEHEVGEPMSSAGPGPCQATAAPPTGPDAAEGDPVEAGSGQLDMDFYSKEVDAEGYDAGDSGAQFESGVSVLDNGLAAQASGGAGADSDNGEGLTAGASVQLGGGVSAAVHVERLHSDASADNGCRVTVTIVASASLDASTQFAQDSQGGKNTPFSGGLGVSAGMEGSWTTAEFVSGPAGELIASSWEGGDYMSALRSLSSAAAIIERLASGNAVSVDTDGLSPGEVRKSETSIEGALCIPASWGVASVEVSAAQQGTAEREIAFTSAGMYEVRVGFSAMTTLTADGELDLGVVQLTGGVATEVLAGLALEYTFTHTEKHLADRVLAAADRRELERISGELAVSPRVTEELDGETTSSQEGIARGDFQAGWDQTQERRDEIHHGVDGMDGTSIHGQGGDGFSVGYGGETLVGLSDGSSLDASVHGGEITATFQTQQTATTLGMGWPSLKSVKERDWPTAFKEAFVHEHDRLTGVKFNDSDIRDIVQNRVFDVGNWDKCARTIDTNRPWVQTGAAMRAAKPPAEWSAADPEMAVLVTRMQILADFVADHGAASHHVVHNLTQRFGQDGEHEDLGTLETWPPEMEDLYNVYNGTVRPMVDTLVEELSALTADGDTTGGIQLATSVQVGLRMIQQGVASTPTADHQAQTRILDELGEELVDVGYHLELFALMSEGGPDQCAADTGLVVDGQQAELRTLMETMSGYQKVEAGILGKAAGDSSDTGLEDFQIALNTLYEKWRSADMRAAALSTDESSARGRPAPDLDAVEALCSATWPTYTMGTYGPQTMFADEYEYWRQQ